MPGHSDFKFTVPGDIVSTNADEIRVRLWPLVQQAAENSVIAIDLRATRLIDSVGLNLLVSAIKNGATRKVRLRLHVAHPNVVRILNFTRMHLYADITQEAPDA